MSEQANRRELEFDSLDEVQQDVRTLLENGYQANGNWNLAQICGHLTHWLSYPMDGYPRPPLPIRIMLKLMKWFNGRKTFKQILSAKKMKSGLPTLKNTVPQSDEAEDQAAVEKLLETIERAKSYSGEIHPSPLFGEMTREEFIQLQLVHCAHHLSFLQLKT